MAIFVAFSDESGTQSNHKFYYSGLVAPESDWNNLLVPDWQKNVLDGPPSIKFLHMSADKPNGEEKELCRLDIERRVENAVKIISGINTICPVTIYFDEVKYAEMLPSTFQAQIGKQQATFDNTPDFLGFILYAYSVLVNIPSMYPNVERIDFVIEKKDGKSKVSHKNEKCFFPTIPSYLRETGRPDLADICGKLTVAGKECIPLQAVDVWLWHLQRAKAGYREEADMARFNRMIDRLSIESKPNLEVLGNLDWNQYTNPVK
jgi:hypothetical protein